MKLAKVTITCAQANFAAHIQTNALTVRRTLIARLLALSVKIILAYSNFYKMAKCVHKVLSAKVLTALMASARATMSTEQNATLNTSASQLCVTIRLAEAQFITTNQIKTIPNQLYHQLILSLHLIPEKT